MSVSYETGEGACIFHGSVSPLYYRLPPGWMFVPLCLCGERAALDVFVFASESERQVLVVVQWDGGGVELVASSECVYFCAEH